MKIKINGKEEKLGFGYNPKSEELQLLTDTLKIEFSVKYLISFLKKIGVV